MDYIDGDNATLCNGKPAFQDCNGVQDATSNTARFHNGIQFEIWNVIKKACDKHNV